MQSQHQQTTNDRSLVMKTVSMALIPGQSNMQEFRFTLKFRLQSSDSEEQLDQLCRDVWDKALVDISHVGDIALRFTTRASSFNDAMGKALADVRRSIPVEEGRLIEVLD